jgi:mRNA-degrading endonuclease RelE of RelBE toxin-antitoxin system
VSRYELAIKPRARRALAERLPFEVAAAAAELIQGPLLAQPYRVGKALHRELTGLYSARLATQWRIIYTIDEVARVVTVETIQHRGAVYRSA